MKSNDVLKSLGIAILFSFSASLARSGDSYAIKNGIRVGSVLKVVSAAGAETVIVPKGNNNKGGFGSDKEDIYCLLIRDALLSSGPPNEIKSNVIIPRIMTSENHKEITQFYDRLVKNKFPIEYVYAPKKDKNDQSGPEISMDKTFVLNGAIRSLLLVVDQKGAAVRGPLSGFSGKKEDQETQVRIGTAFYLNLALLESSSGTIETPTSTISGVRRDSDVSVFVGGLTQDPH